MTHKKFLKFKGPGWLLCCFIEPTRSAYPVLGMLLNCNSTICCVVSLSYPGFHHFALLLVFCHCQIIYISKTLFTLLLIFPSIYDANSTVPEKKKISLTHELLEST